MFDSSLQSVCEITGIAERQQELAARAARLTTVRWQPSIGSAIARSTHRGAACRPRACYSSLSALPGYRRAGSQARSGLNDEVFSTTTR